MTAEIVGRELELAKVDAFIDAAGRTYRGLVLEGEAGIGKSTLWREGVEQARARGVRVLTSRPAEAELGLAFVGLGDLLEGVADTVLPRLSPPRRRALAAALIREDAPGDQHDSRALGVAVRDALDILARDQLLLVAIDDVQWFDDSSARALAFALRRLGTQRVLAFVARRGTQVTHVEQAIDTESIAVGPLSLGAIQKFLHDRLDRSLPRPVVLRIYEASGGSPFYALELARTLDVTDELTKPIPMSASLERLIEVRLRGLPKAARDALLIVAAYGRPTARQLPMKSLAPAFKARIVEESDGVVRFSHPLLASAVYAGASPEDRRNAHNALAKTVDDPIARARHLALATAGQDAKIAGALDAASAAANLRGAAMASAELAELALRVTPDSDHEYRRRRMLAYAERLCDAGDGRRAIALLDQARKTVPPGVERARVLVALARAEESFVGAREGVVRFRAALAEAEGDSALLAEIHLSLANLMKDTEDAKFGLEHSELAVQAATSAGDLALRCRSLAMYCLLHSRTGLGSSDAEMEEALAIERSLPPTHKTGAATRALVYQLIWSGRLDDARRVLERWLAELAAADDRRQEEALWYLSMLELRAGNWRLAARHAATSLAIRAEFGIEGSQPIAELPAAMVAAHSGMVEEARRLSTRALARAEAEGVRIAESGHRAVLGFIELSLGEPEKALQYLRKGWEIRDTAMLLEPGHRFELADTLEALIAVGDLREAEEKLSRWEERARALDRSWALAITARCRALLLAARGDITGAQQQFERAVREHERTQDPFQHARTLLAFGATQRRAKQRAAARAHLEGAQEIFDRLPAPLWAAKVRSELARIGGRPPAKEDELTEAERRIAELVAEGRTNHEVAASLFVGERTVASHLTHIYAKLGVRSRTELARRLH
ncbi:MAG TPA: AAA family ATPase [Candidatus Sulfotelmatobacter sp.]|nr:AAA family ATPase [Candidatus Sulfotelmatobacter sp.]